ncbi:dipeptidase [Rhodococcus koreensis]|uniref:dipeptidase n=1 Tax=Rhodococcus koreensis TaxID=99653 RepID=UPI00366C2AF7
MSSTPERGLSGTSIGLRARRGTLNRVVCFVLLVLFLRPVRSTLPGAGEQSFAHPAEWVVRIVRRAPRSVVKNGSDLQRAADNGMVGVLLSFQNTSAFDDDIRFVRLYSELGVRVVQLTYNTQNSVGAGCYEANDSGLTEYGALLVREMNDCGMLIDVSHCGDKTALDAVAVSRTPVVITHANLRKFADKTRNKSDDVCRAIADNGGIIGLATYSNLLPRGGDTSIEEFCDLVEATVDLVGIDHVGLGTDYYDGMPPEMVIGWTTGRWSRTVPAHMDLAGAGWNGELPPHTDWFKSPRDMPNVTRALQLRGFDDKSVAAIMGGNWVRLMNDVFGA